MTKRFMTGLVAATFLLAATAGSPAWADNAMNYTLLSVQEAASLPRNGGSLGLDIERSREISDNGMLFDLIGVKGVRPRSAGAAAGFKPGDQIIAVDSRIFPTVASFAAYVGSKPPGSQGVFDYIPRGAGPNGAQRVTVTFGKSDGAAQAKAAESTGMSTGKKVAIGVGAAALLGCYELGCFSKREAAPAMQAGQPGYDPPGYGQPRPGQQGYGQPQGYPQQQVR